MEKIYIIGIGDDGMEGLTSAARQKIETADLLVGAERSLAAVPRGRSGERLELTGDLDTVVQAISSAAGRRTVVLASGDPLFYGTARYLCDRLGKERFEVIPHVSSMQLAFARVKESWDEAYLTNLATQQLPLVAEKIRTAQKVGLFTTEAASPRRVAQVLLELGIDYFTSYVCENLGAPDERVTHGELSEVATQDFSPLNVMILIRKPDLPDRPLKMVGRRLFGNPDEMFLQTQPKRGLLTPAEVRSVALAAMDIGRTSIVWDVGAGSGSVAIEAAQIAAGGSVYAIEMDPEDHQMIAVNAERFGVRNLTRILGQAPEAWVPLPDPDAVFVGGTGRQVRSIVQGALQRLKPGGRLVANVSSIDNLSGVHQLLHDICGDAEVLMINLARGTLQLESIRFEAQNPTFLIRAVKR
ncbi:MAG: precorrin-6y C5,15-methyltransferase (decarboxylating) subunit CbiE [Planctomycetes bacterium]|nr:precorrin-6y C5,15-methyltransferase (decarboxylating) subunit CbiE [Planctomycetota bacterium]